MQSDAMTVERLRSSVGSILKNRPVRVAYVYGSVAIGNSTPLSDVDIALVVDGDLTPLQQLRLGLRLTTEIAEQTGVRKVEARVINHAPLALRGLVACRGILLYARDEASRRPAGWTLRRPRATPISTTSRWLGVCARPYSLICEKGDCMVDLEKLQGILGNLRQYTGYLGGLATVSRDDFLADPIKVGAAKYYAQAAIECCLDIANHIISTSTGRASPRSPRSPAGSGPCRAG